MKEVKIPNPIDDTTDTRMLVFSLNVAFEKLGADVKVEYDQFLKELIVYKNAEVQLKDRLNGKPQILSNSSSSCSQGEARPVAKRRD